MSLYIYFEDGAKRDRLTVQQPFYGMPGDTVAKLTVSKHTPRGTILEQDEGFRTTLGLLMRGANGKPRSEGEALHELERAIARAHSVADGVATAVRRSALQARRS
ncbi:MAG: hypothetical protein KGH69_04500 [Candidatus Micrarchaeota archaeon]|nr:hypothetical protein [Candidatus Micrarchaeota archaeon]